MGIKCSGNWPHHQRLRATCAWAALHWQRLPRVLSSTSAAGRAATILGALEFLYERPAGPESIYAFKHVLTQDVAYASLPGERRRVVHAPTAQAVEVLYAQRLEEHYGELAHQYRHSGQA